MNLLKSIGRPEKQKEDRQEYNFGLTSTTVLSLMKGKMSKRIRKLR